MEFAKRNSGSPGDRLILMLPPFKVAALITAALAIPTVRAQEARLGNPGTLDDLRARAEMGGAAANTIWA